MAQDNRADRSQGAAPNRQQPQVPPNSPYYTKDNMPEGCSPAARWLFAKGWKCLGDPNWESAVWYAPDAPEVETSHREPKFGKVRRMTGRDSKGDPIIESVSEQLKQQDGANPNNMGQPTELIEQLVVTFPAAPLGFRQAVEMQQARDEKAQRDARAAKTKEAAA